MSVLLIIEGVTGTGKSSTIEALLLWGQHNARAVRVIDEEITLGTFLDDVNDPAWRKRPDFPGLEAGLAAAIRHLQEDRDALVVLERFHLSAYALLGRWRPLDRYDLALSELGAVQVLLDYPPPMIEARSILRPDREDWATGMDQCFGSRSGAIDAVARSQEKRRRGLVLSRLPFLHLSIDTLQWEVVAATIVAFCGHQPSR